MMDRFLLLLILGFLITACLVQPAPWGIIPTPTPPPPTPTADDPVVGASHLASPLNPLPALPTPFQPIPDPIVSPPVSPKPIPPLVYYVQSGDSLEAVAKRFEVQKSEIVSLSTTLPEEGLIDEGILLFIPDRLSQADKTPKFKLLPDSEIVFSPSAADFDVASYVKQSGGYLSRYTQWLATGGYTEGAEIVRHIALENSINPRLLLALLEYESGWVLGNPPNLFRQKHPFGIQMRVDGENELYQQLQWAIAHLFKGYYGWRSGTLTELVFPNGERLRIDPELNAGTVALFYFFSRSRNRVEWERVIDPTLPNGFLAYYREMFGDPWARARTVEPLFPPGLAQPWFILPFEPKIVWSYTSGPHGAWDRNGPLAALDFAPQSSKRGCDLSPHWATAVAPGVIVRAENGVVILDLDGDGNEHTGWVVLYLHVAETDRVQVGQWLQTGDRIGHPSCEGGSSTGRHIHIARKYNGEWILADGPLPFVLSGWRARAGAVPYQGTLERNGQVIIADVYGQSWSLIVREPDE